MKHAQKRLFPVMLALGLIVILCGAAASARATSRSVPHLQCGGWSIVPSPKVAFAVLYSVAAISENDAWAVGEHGGNGSQTLIEHWNGTDWRVVSSPNPGMDDILT